MAFYDVLSIIGSYQIVPLDGFHADFTWLSLRSFVSYYHVCLIYCVNDVCSFFMNAYISDSLLSIKLTIRTGIPLPLSQIGHRQSVSVLDMET